MKTSLLLTTGFAATLGLTPAGFAQDDYDADYDGVRSTDREVTVERDDEAYRRAEDRSYRNDRYVDDSEWFGPQGGEWEMTLAGSGNNDKDFENGGFNVSVDASYYFSEAASLGVRQDVSFADTGNSSWNGATQVFGQLHFGDTPLRPFVGAGIGYLYGDDVNDTFFGGPEAGIRYYVKPETFIFARATYQFLFDSGDEIDDQFDDGRFVYTLGVGFTF